MSSRPNLEVVMRGRTQASLCAMALGSHLCCTCVAGLLLLCGSCLGGCSTERPNASVISNQRASSVATCVSSQSWFRRMQWEMTNRSEGDQATWSYTSSIMAVNVSGMATVRPFSVSQWAVFEAVGDKGQSCAVFNAATRTSLVVVRVSGDIGRAQPARLGRWPGAEVAGWVLRHQSASGKSVKSDWMSFLHGRFAGDSFPLSGAVMASTADGKILRIKVEESLRTLAPVPPDKHLLGESIDRYVRRMDGLAEEVRRSEGARKSEATEKYNRYKSRVEELKQLRNALPSPGVLSEGEIMGYWMRRPLFDWDPL